jgi:hypothetical protein
MNKITAVASASIAVAEKITGENVHFRRMLQQLEHLNKIHKSSSTPPSHKTQFVGQFTPLSSSLTRVGIAHTDTP